MKKNLKVLFAGAVIFGATGFAAAQTATKTETAAAAATQSSTKSEALLKAVQANPQDTQALANLATAYQEEQNWTAAIDTWKKLSALLPDWAPAYYSEGYAYQSAKDDANAKAAYEKYISMVKPEEVEANKKNLAYAHLYVAYAEQATNKESAKQHLSKSLEYDPSNPDAVKLSEALK